MKNNRGYSLPEIMLVVATLGIIASVAPVMFSKTYEFFSITSAKTDIQRDMRVVMEAINRTLRQAKASKITIDRASSSQPPCSRITYCIEGDSLSYSYYQDGSKIMMARGTGSGTKICENLSYLSFYFPRSDDMSIVSVSITLQKSIYRGFKKAIHVAIEKVRIMNE